MRSTLSRGLSVNPKSIVGQPTPRGPRGGCLGMPCQKPGESAHQRAVSARLSERSVVRLRAGAERADLAMRKVNRERAGGDGGRRFLRAHRVGPMSHLVDFDTVSTIGLESSPVAPALAGLVASGSRPVGSWGRRPWAILGSRPSRTRASGRPSISRTWHPPMRLWRLGRPPQPEHPGHNPPRRLRGTQGSLDRYLDHIPVSGATIEWCEPAEARSTSCRPSSSRHRGDVARSAAALRAAHRSMTVATGSCRS